MGSRSVLSIGILGPTVVEVGTRSVGLEAASARELLVVLALHRHGPVSTERLVDVLWGENLPNDPVNALHSRVRKLRRSLDAAGLDGAELVRTESGGYRLDVGPDAVDAWRFESLAGAAVGAGASDPTGALALAEEALALVRGEVFADARKTELGQNEAVRFEELRYGAEELRVEGMLRSGRIPDAVAALTKLVGDNPYNERFAAQLMLALYRSGRQTDALDVYAATRARLVEELGVDPGPELESLELRILRHDADLALPEDAGSVGDAATAEVLVLLDAGAPGDVAHRKTDTFRDLVDYPDETRTALAEGRSRGVGVLRGLEDGMRPLDRADPAAVVDLMLSYRAVEAWDDVCRVVSEMAPEVAGSVLVREQNAFALNRLGRHEQAARELTAIIDAYGPSSESASLLGRVRKDQWAAALDGDGPAVAAPLLEEAIDAYLMGFEADWRDAYPGINALTLMEVRDPPDPRRVGLRPLVRYAVERRLASPDPDYWDHATLLELAAIEGDEAAARALVARVAGAKREPWEPATTARNLGFLRDGLARSGRPADWLSEVIDDLLEAAGRPPAL